jgi:hypothetical protein
MMVVMTTTMGHKCERRKVWGNQQERGVGEERILRGEEDGSTHTYA